MVANHAVDCRACVQELSGLGDVPDAASCAYTPSPDDTGGVINASAYRAFLLTKAGTEFSESRYLDVAKRNLNFVLASQNADGSWYYSTDGNAILSITFILALS